MNRTLAGFACFAGLLIPALFFNPSVAAGQQQPKLDSDYAVQGEYAGELTVGDQTVVFGLQVIALGEGKFSGVGFHGGLPGDGWDGSEGARVTETQIVDGELKLVSPQGTVVIKDGVGKAYTPDEQMLGTLKRVERTSNTLGAKPPEGAIVLFGDGSEDAKQAKEKYSELWTWKGKPGQVSEDGWLMQGTETLQKFQSFKLHIEFRLPYQPKSRGQQRGNSGIYLQGRHEVQMLDSFGLSGEQNECGGIYSIKKPDLNMCYPPMQWQTYDIEFHAAQFDGDKRTKDAWMTVEHNGVVIHEKVDLKKKTTAAPVDLGPEAGPIYLQDHGNQVRYRNIWLLPVDGDDAKEKN